MKKSIFLLLVLLGFATAESQAESGDLFVSVAGGYLHPRTLQATVAVEKEMCFENAFEFYFDFSNRWQRCDLCGEYCKNSLKHANQAYRLGAAYKLPLYRGYNSLVRLRTGADLGVQSKELITGIGLGLEYTYSFSNGMAFTLQQKNDLLCSDKVRMYSGVLIGVKIPLYR